MEFTNKKDLNKWLADQYLYDGDEIIIDHKLIPDPLEFALQNISTVVHALQDKFPDCTMEFYIGGEGNFRKELATLQPYKGNRSEFAKPTHYDNIRKYLVSKYNATVVFGQETDDAVGIRATELGDKCVIVTTDKDLDTIVGWHYNWVKKEFYYVDEVLSYKCFYTQLLTGDTTDNIPGLVGIGPKTAARILAPYTTPKGMWQAVLTEYSTRCPNGFMGRGVRDALREIGNLLYIRKHPNEEWSFP